MAPTSQPVEARFLSHVDRQADGCWLWTAARFSNGYGAFKVWPKMWRAHRWAYEHFIGPIPAGLRVLHSCDVPHCVNPEHLWLGTDKDNQEDMTQKGRGRGGKRNGAVTHPAKLSQELADEIRARYGHGDVTQADLASEYSVSQTMIGLIVRGLRWNPASYLD